MKSNPENIAIATLYLFLLLITLYVIKLAFQKYRALDQRKQRQMQDSIYKQRKQEAYSKLNTVQTFTKSWLLKYSLIGGIINKDKRYLLKEITIVSIICTSCLTINSITIWPFALIVPLLVLLFFPLQFWKPNIKCWQTSVANQDIQLSQEIQIQQEKSKTNANENFSPKQITLLSILSFLTLVLLSHTIFTIYNSVSNLGLLNIQSLVIIVCIDQVAFRLGITAAISISYYIVTFQNINLLHYTLFECLCSQQIQYQIGEIIKKYQNMSVSPSKKKSSSPSKVPKALFFQQEDTLMLFKNTTKLQQTLKSIREEPNLDSPINEISKEDTSQVIFTTQEKRMFQKYEQNDVYLSNSILTNEEQNKKQRNNQFYSAQKPHKYVNEEKLGDQDLILVENELNMVKNKRKTEAYQTLDINMSPLRRRKGRPPQQKNRRQLIITGSSPYLQYLPDMLKKAKGNGNSSQAICRKVL